MAISIELAHCRIRISKCGGSKTSSPRFTTTIPAKTTSLARTSKKILVTGGTGFLGTHIVRQMLDAGEKNLRVMASSVPGWMKDSGVEAAEGSVMNAQDLADAVRGVLAIFHLAG